MPRKVTKRVSIAEDEERKVYGRLKRQPTPIKPPSDVKRSKEFNWDEENDLPDIPLTPRVVIERPSDTSDDDDAELNLKLSGTAEDEITIADAVGELQSLWFQMNKMAGHEAWKVKEDLCECSLRTAIQKITTSMATIAVSVKLCLAEIKQIKDTK